MNSSTMYLSAVNLSAMHLSAINLNAMSSRTVRSPGLASALVRVHLQNLATVATDLNDVKGNLLAKKRGERAIGCT